MKLRDHCPGCAGTELTDEFRLARQPVVLNYRFRDAAAASRVPREDVTLRQCRHCGLVFNATFDGALIPYDENYENRQHHSPTFTAHLEALARQISTDYPVRGGRILEVGCGKGDFLRLICEVAEAEGEGYDTSYEAGEQPEPPGLKFHRSYVSAADVTQPFQVVLCRHVVEHVPEIGDFLRELAAIARAAGDPVVILETPRFEWIVEQLSLWDVFYEHCNYFPMASLAFLCRQAGFSVVGHRPAFGDQYQVLALKVCRQPEPLIAPGIPAGAHLADFACRSRNALISLADKVITESDGKGWAVWGAGAKGVALVNQFPGEAPRCVVDVNPSKQGGRLPGTTIPIVSDSDPMLDGIGLILIANPNYAEEIKAVLRRRGFAGRTLTL
jgi:SAM-dependent methyltransferase